VEKAVATDDVVEEVWVAVEAAVSESVGSCFLFFGTQHWEVYSFVNKLQVLRQWFTKLLIGFGLAGMGTMELSLLHKCTLAERCPLGQPFRK